MAYTPELSLNRPQPFAVFPGLWGSPMTVGNRVCVRLPAQDFGPPEGLRCLPGPVEVYRVPVQHQ